MTLEGFLRAPQEDPLLGASLYVLAVTMLDNGRLRIAITPVDGNGALVGYLDENTFFPTRQEEGDITLPNPVLIFTARTI